MVEVVKRIPGARFDGKLTMWVVPKEFYPPGQYTQNAYVQIFANWAVKKGYERSVTKGNPASKPDVNMTLPPMPELVTAHGLKIEPYGYQKQGIAYALQKKRCFFGDQPGLGKTLQAIGTAFMAKSYPTLVICPASLKINWQREWKKFTGKDAMILDDRNKNSWQRFYEMGCCDVFITNYESLKKFFVTDMAGGDKKYHLHTGMEVNSLDLKIASGKLAQGTFNFVGQTLTASTIAPTGATFGSPSTTAPMDSFTGTVTEGGSANGVITELGLKIENGLNQRFVVGSRDSLRPQIGRSVVTGNLSVFFETSTLLDKFLADTASSLVFTLQSGAKSYSFNLPNLKYTSGQAEVQGEGAIMVPMSFQAVYSSGDSTQLAVTRVP